MKNILIDDLDGTFKVCAPTNIRKNSKLEDHRGKFKMNFKAITDAKQEKVTNPHVSRLNIDKNLTLYFNHFLPDIIFICEVSTG